MELEQPNSRTSSSNLIIVYKLLNDLLFIEAVFFILAMIGEALLPGTITSHVGFSKVIVTVGVTILAILYVGNKAGVNLSQAKKNKKTAYLLVTILVILLFVSLIKINLMLNIILSFFAVLMGYYFYKLIILDSNKD
jgi:hypothetical protein